MNLEVLYLKHRKTFIFKLYPYVHNYELAEDLVQEAFTRAFSKFDQYDEKKGSVKGWFTKILFSCLWNHKKQNKRQPITYDIDSVSESDLLAYEEEPNLREYLESVSNTKHRKALISCLLLGHTYTEAAAVSSLDTENVRKVVYRFRERER